MYQNTARRIPKEKHKGKEYHSIMILPLPATYVANTNDIYRGCNDISRCYTIIREMGCHSGYLLCSCHQRSVDLMILNVYAI